METEARFLTSLLGCARHHCDRLARACKVLCACTLVAGPMCLAAQSPPPRASSLPSEARHFAAPRLNLQGVPNFGQVTPRLYRGAQPTEEGFAGIAKLGINIVVDLRGSRASERRVVTGLGMRYVAFPWHCYSPRDEVLAQFLTLLRENPGKKVFVHCKVGDDRTGMDIAAYRMVEQGWTAEEARKEMEAYGVNWFHRMICPRLRSYENEFPRRFETSPAFQGLRSDKHAPQP